MADYGVHVLTKGIRSFTILNEYFDPTQSEIVGYKRTYNTEFYNSLSFNIASHPKITGYNLQATGGAMLMSFEWDLHMPSEQADVLEVIVQSHRSSVANKDASWWVTLQDARLPIAEVSATRPVATGSPVGFSGGVRYYAQFKLLITEFERSVFLPGIRDKVKMKALEVP